MVHMNFVPKLRESSGLVLKTHVVLYASCASLFNEDFGVSPKHSPSERYRNFFITLPSKHRIQRRCPSSSSAAHSSLSTPYTLFSSLLNAYPFIQLIFTSRAMGHCLGNFAAPTFLCPSPRNNENISSATNSILPVKN